MSIKKDDSGKRWVSAEVEVPGTPEEVWQAIATGPGISSWFVPTEIKEDGTVISEFGPGMTSVAKEVVTEPPKRFVKEGEMGGQTMATEWTVEAKSGGTCIVRVVHSLFASTDDWDGHLESIEKGWPDFFEILKLYLRNFRGQKCSAIQLMGMGSEAPEVAWDKVASALGLENATVGQSRKSARPDLPFAGVVERVGAAGHPQQALVRLTEPAPGIAHLFAMKMGKQVFVSARLFFYGSTAEKTLTMQEPAWRKWIDSLFPSAQPAGAPKAALIEARAKERLSCSAEQLYDAWLDSAKIRAWMSQSLKTFGLAGDLRRIETDPRVGGKFCFSDMRNGAEAIHVGEYLELDRPRKIVFTWLVGDSLENAWQSKEPSKVTLTIEPDGAGCIATMVHEMDPKWAEYVSRTEQGWSRMLKAIEASYVD